jgi:AAA+ superfamily predicted ATPase
MDDALTGDTPRTSPRAAACAVLDRLLAIAVERQAQRLGPESLLDPWRGLHLGVEDVRAALGGSAHDALGAMPGVAALMAHAAAADGRIGRMRRWLDLDDNDVAIVLLALAPELDLRYERIYAYLQDDMTRKRPTFDMVASLLCADVDERGCLVRRLDPDAPLVRHAVFDPGSSDVPLAARALVLDVAWRNFLLARDEMDPRMARYARLLAPPRLRIDECHADPAIADRVKALCTEAIAGRDALRLVLVGPHGAGKRSLALALAHELGLRLLVVDLRDIATAQETRECLRRARLGSALLGALPYIHGAGALAGRDRQLAVALTESLAASGAWFVLSLVEPLPQLHGPALTARQLRLERPSTEARLALWRSALAAASVECDEGDMRLLASRFRVSGSQIAQAVVDAAGMLSSRSPWRASEAQLAAATRALCGDELARLAQRVSPQATFADLVATSEAQAQLREICARVVTRETVRSRWTRECVHARNAGVTALFTGPSGTGKTLAAEVVAGELGYDLFRIDLSAIVSKYIGETEKNLDRVFAAAEYANAVLFFDEADALFGKRSEVKDAHDRYANIEIAYLLQKMEQFDGLAILATNLKQNLDEAFARRLTFSVNFAFPEVAERRRLWDALWPRSAPRAADVDLDWFAREYPLSGGNIRNTVLAAVHLAAADGEAVCREHLLHATRREYQKLGKTIAHPGAIARGSAA